MVKKCAVLTVLLSVFFFAGNSAGQTWDIYSTGLYCNRCHIKATPIESNDIGNVDLNIGEGFHRFVIELGIYGMDSDWAITKVMFYGQISKQKFKNCFVLEDEAIGCKILIKRNWRNNWIIKDGPAIIKGLELDILSRMTYQSGRFEKLFTNSDRKILPDSSSSTIETIRDAVFTDRDGFALYFEPDGHYLLTMGNGKNECYIDCVPISKGKYSQKGKELNFIDNGKLKPFTGHVVNRDTIICTNVPGGTITFLRKNQ